MAMESVLRAYVLLGVDHVHDEPLLLSLLPALAVFCHDAPPPKNHDLDF
jgi:hypothetical protein